MTTGTSPLRGILFDKDGTLIDFNASWMAPCKAAAAWLAETAGQPERSGELLTLGGFDAASDTWAADSLLASGTADQVLALWSDALDVSVGDAERIRMASFFEDASAVPYPAVDDLRAWFERWRARGYALGIATMDDERGARHLLEQLDAADSVDFVAGYDSGHGLKPEPGMLLAFCDLCQLQPAEVVMVGDSPRDLAMGRAAGAGLVVGIAGVTASHEELAPLADHVLDALEALEHLPELQDATHREQASEENRAP